MCVADLHTEQTLEQRITQFSTRVYFESEDVYLGAILFSNFD